MARRCVHRLWMTRGRTVAAAVIRRAQVRAAFKHLARNPDVGHAGIVARLPRGHRAGSPGYSRPWGIGLVFGRVPIGGPFPHVADHVVDAIAVRRERGHRRGAFVAIQLEILVRERALPGVCHLLAARCELIAPGELGAVKAAASRKLPFRLGRQVLAGPFRVGHGVPVGDVNDGMIIEPADRTARSIGPPPVGAKFECPPLAPVVHIDRMLRRIENQRARLEHVRQSARIVLRIRRDLGEGDIAGRLHEIAEFAVGNWSPVDPETRRPSRDGLAPPPRSACPIPCGTCRRESRSCRRAQRHPRLNLAAAPAQQRHALSSSDSSNWRWRSVREPRLRERFLQSIGRLSHMPYVVRRQPCAGHTPNSFDGEHTTRILAVASPSAALVLCPRHGQIRSAIQTSPTAVNEPGRDDTHSLAMNSVAGQTVYAVPPCRSSRSDPRLAFVLTVVTPFVAEEVFLHIARQHATEVPTARTPRHAKHLREVR